VVRVDNFEALQKGYARVTKQMRGAKIVAGALEQGSDNEDEEQQVYKNTMPIFMLFEDAHNLSGVFCRRVMPRHGFGRRL
jgi:hypothetical protein